MPSGMIFLRNANGRPVADEKMTLDCLAQGIGMLAWMMTRRWRVADLSVRRAGAGPLHAAPERASTPVRSIR